jgi:hypothetical protein
MSESRKNTIDNFGQRESSISFTIVCLSLFTRLETNPHNFQILDSIETPESKIMEVPSQVSGKRLE